MTRLVRAALFAVTLAAAPAVAVASPSTPVSAPLAPATTPTPATTPGELAPVTASQSARDVAIAEAAADDWQGNVARLYDAIRSGRWLAAIAAALLIAVFVVRRFALGRIAWFQTRAGGWAINFALASGAALAVGLQGGSVGVGVVLDALLLGLSAAGTYQAVRDARRSSVAKPGVDA